MKKSKKFKAAAGILLNSLYIVLFLFTLLVTAGALAGTLSKKQPSVFGFTVSEILSSSMEKSGFYKGDFVVTKNIRDVNELAAGDIVTYYAHKDGRPMLEKGDRSDMIVIFHEVVGIYEEDGVRFLITKGSSNTSPDAYPVPFESASGRYVKSGPVFDFLIKTALKSNMFLYWAIMCLALVILYQLLVIARAAGEIGLRRQVIIGRRPLLDKECFQKNIFEGFGDGDKEKLIRRAPYGMKVLYQFLLYGKISAECDPETAAKAAGRRLTAVDALFITYSKEKDSLINGDEYLKRLPQKKEKLNKYRNISEFKNAAKKEKAQAYSFFTGCLIFALLYFIIAFATNFFPVAPWYEVLIAALLPGIAYLYFVLSLLEARQTEKQLYDYFGNYNYLPDRYRFVIEPERFSKEEIAENVRRIKELLYRALL